MKQLIISVFLLLNLASAVAQNAKAHVSPDTVRISTPGKPKVYPGTGMRSDNSIITNLQRAGRFGIFLSALKKAGLTETFDSKGPITLFAPEDDAFTAIRAKMDTLMLPAHHFELVNLLTYQAIPGTINIKNIKKMIRAGKGKAALTTLSGNKITATLADGNVLLTDQSGGQVAISKLNIKQLNGLIHITGSVLVPKYKQI